jgi:hypothetical protein
MKAIIRESLLKGRITTVGLLVVTSLNPLLLKLLFYITSYL